MFLWLFYKSFFWLFHHCRYFRRSRVNLDHSNITSSMASMASSMASSIFLSHIYIFEEKKQQVPRYATLKYYISVKNIQFYRFIFLVWFKSREVASCLFVWLVGFCSCCFDFFATVLTITFGSTRLGTIYKMGPWDCR